MKRICSFAVAAGLLLSSAASWAAENYLTHPEYQKFAAMMVAEHGFKRDKLDGLFSGVKRQDKIIKAMTRPAEKVMPWYRYQKIFLKTQRITAGIKFWKENEAILARAEQQYGVPPEIIVAIIGVETRFGQYMGRDRVIDAVSTLGFDYPKRAKFFSSELKHFLLLCQEEGFDPLVPKGSYAGAMGMPQFISSSYRNFAVDFNNDGKRDLFADKEDIIGSVANYFAKHNWQQGKAVERQIKRLGPLAAERTTMKADKPKTTVEEWLASGLEYRGPLVDSNGKAVILKLETAPEKFEYWLALDNFYAITRYNHSPMYAMAVWRLAQGIRAKRSTLPGNQVAYSSPPKLALQRYR